MANLERLFCLVRHLELWWDQIMRWDFSSSFCKTSTNQGNAIYLSWKYWNAANQIKSCYCILRNKLSWQCYAVLASHNLWRLVERILLACRSGLDFQHSKGYAPLRRILDGLQCLPSIVNDWTNRDLLLNWYLVSVCIWNLGENNFWKESGHRCRVTLGGH